MIALLTIMAAIVTTIVTLALRALRALDNKAAAEAAWIKAEEMKRQQAARDHAAQVAIWELSGLKISDAEMDAKIEAAQKIQTPNLADEMIESVDEMFASIMN